VNGSKESTARRNGIRAHNARRAGLKSVAAVCLPIFVLVAVVVAHGQGPYAFEDRYINWLGPPSAVRTWVDLIDLLAGPAIGVVLVVSVVIGYVRGALSRVIAFAVLAAATLLLSEYVAKPLVRRGWEGLLTFPSGHVTAVTATALAMWLALTPLLGKRARRATFAVGAGWALLMSVAVIGARWHTPVDVLGSLLLAVGFVALGAVVLEPVLPQGPSEGTASTSRSRGRARRTQALTAKKR
jgi:membrane-associated phospholipid phosphatase